MLDKEIMVLKYFKKSNEKYVTEEDISSFEEKYKLIIPKDYKSFLLEYNGVDILSPYEYKEFMREEKNIIIEDNNIGYIIRHKKSKRNQINFLHSLKDIIAIIEGYDMFPEDMFTEDELPKYVEKEREESKKYQSYMLKRKSIPITIDIGMRFYTYIDCSKKNSGKIYSRGFRECDDEYQYEEIADSFSNFLKDFYLYSEDETPEDEDDYDY